MFKINGAKKCKEIIGLSKKERVEQRGSTKVFKYWNGFVSSKNTYKTKSHTTFEKSIKN